MKIKRRLISLVVLFFILVFAWIVFNTSNREPVIFSNFGTNIPQDFPILGIDVSHHQGAVNWPLAGDMAVDGDSLQFVYIKATEGTDWVDDQADENAKGAGQEGLKYGFYHFFLPTISATAQALHFCQEMPEGAELPPVIDIETDGKYTKARLVDSVLVFMALVEKKTGKRPIVYTYVDLYKTKFTGTALEHEYFWIASYADHCTLMARENFLIWQFSQSGTVSGIREPVDLNIAKDDFFSLLSVQ